MNHDALSEALRRAAADIELRPGSAHAAKLRGTRRRHRNRRVGVAFTAAATVGVTAVGLQQLTRPASVGSGQAPEPAAPSASGPSAAPQLDALPLTLVEPSMVWNRIDPDSSEAVSYGAGVYSAQLPELPGVMVSTAPGKSEYARRLWRSEDGIHWAEAGPLPQGMSATAASWAQGNRIYVVGTMPAAAGSEHLTGPVRVSVSDDAGEHWSAVDVPVDNPALMQIPGVLGVNTQIGGVAGNGNLTMVLVRQRAEVGEQRDLLVQAGIDPDRGVVMSDGVMVSDCIAPAATVPYPSEPGPPGTVPCDEDDQETIPFSDLGAVGVTLQAAVAPQSRLFATTDGATFTEVAIPDVSGPGDTQLYRLGNQVVFATRPFGGDGLSAWTTGDGVTWQTVTLPANTYSGVHSVGGSLVAFVYDSTGSGGMAVSADGATWRSGQISSIVGADKTVIGFGPAATSSAGLTVAAQVLDRPASSPPISTESPVLTTPEALIESPPHFELLHSADGVTWSRESVAQLAGVTDAEIGNVTRVQTAGNTVVVAVNLKAPTAEAIPKQIVLVGTPKS